MQTNPSPTPRQPVAADRRRYPRRSIRGVQGTLRSPGDVTVLELSLTGLSAEFAGEVKPGERCFLELAHGHSRAVVEAVVKWSSLPRIQREAGRPPLVFRAGLEFIDVDHDGGDLLWGCIVPQIHA